jgi:triosephosphate isomerase
VSSRTPVIAGNWKMNKTIAEAEAFIAALLPQVYDTEGVDVAICPSYLALQAMVDSARGSRVGVYAQNMHFKDSGAYTGEVSAAMLTEIDVDGVVLGHSERREYFNETDRALQQKVPKALESGLVPILCVGETLEQREQDQTEAVLRRQLSAVLELCGVDSLARAVVAYEPVWAIGTGRTATPQQAQAAHAFLRHQVASRDARIAAALRVLYGGSVNAGNANTLFAEPDVDGGLIGGASLKADEFLAICAAAQVQTPKT